MNKKVKYSGQWEGLKNARRLFIISFIGFLPGLFLVILVMDIYFSAPSYATILVMLLFGLGIGEIRRRYRMYPCPRCGKAFKGTWRVWEHGYCVNCKLPLWANPTDE